LITHRHAAVLALAGAVAAPCATRADRFEARLTGDLRGGVARVAEPGAAAVTVPALGADVRIGHAWHNALAWDLALGGSVAQPATFTDAELIINGRPVRGDLTRRTFTAAAQVGATLQLGRRTAPTVRLALGPQVRHRTAADLGGIADSVPGVTSLDAVASIALGVELRLGRHLAIGLALQVDHAQPLDDAPAHDVIGISVQVARVWYPRLWGPSW
jgi:hypothetical protein